MSPGKHKKFDYSMKSKAQKPVLHESENSMKHGISEEEEEEKKSDELSKYK